MRTLEIDGCKCFGLDLAEDEAGIWFAVMCNEKLPSPWKLTKQMAGAQYSARLLILTTELEPKNWDILGHAGCKMVTEIASAMGAPQISEIFAKLARGPFAPQDVF